MSKAKIHHYKTDGSLTTHPLKGGTKLSLEELQKLVGGLITILRTDFYGKNCQVVLNEEALIHGLPYNQMLSNRMGFEVYGDGAILEDYEID